jgi:2-dehydropantoate 2-reductase
MQVVIIGAGSVGGYYGGLLVESGHDVLFVARGEHGRAMREKGLTLQSPTATRTLDVHVVDDVAQVPTASAEVVLITVKSPDLPLVAPDVGRVLTAGGVAVPLLNGLDSERELAAVIGDDRVIGGIAQIAAAVEKPGHVHVRAEGSVILAPLKPSGLTRAEQLAAQLADAGLPCVAKKDIERVLWNKLLWNAPFNALCAITGLPAGAVLEIPELAIVATRAVQEVAAVAGASGVQFADGAVGKLIAATKTQFAGSIPSMLQDVRRGKPTEVDALQGAVVRRAQALGVPAPTLEILYGLMLGVDPRGTTDHEPR